MITKIEPNLTPYEKYFVEAPIRRPYMKVVSAFPDNRLKTYDKDMSLVDDNEDVDLDNGDFDTTDDGNYDVTPDEPDEDVDAATPPDTAAADPATPDTPDAPAEPAADTPPADAGGDDPNTITAAPEDTAGDDDMAPDLVDDNGDPAADPNADAGADATADAGADAGGDEGNADAGSFDTSGDDLDATADDAGSDSPIDDAMGGDDAGGDTATDATNGTAPANNAENQLKYSLYRDMNNLYVAIDNYIDKLTETTITSYNYNLAVKTATAKLGDIKDALFEYMTIKFRDNTYVQSMEFYQRCKAAILVIFEILSNNKESQNSDSQTIN